MKNSRYQRQMMLDEIGEEGQTKIRNASVLIVGLGGLGSPVALYLAGAGVGTLGLCDPDSVSETNLHRQVLYTSNQIGEAKTECAQRHLNALNPEIDFKLYSEGLTPENAADIIGGFDIIVDCCDNYATRYLIDDTCHALGKSWIYGAIGEFNGQLSRMNAEAGIRYSDIYPDREYFCSLPRKTSAAFGPVPGAVGAMQASEALKLIAHIPSPLDGKLMIIDFLSLSSNLIDIK